MGRRLVVLLVAVTIVGGALLWRGASQPAEPGPAPVRFPLPIPADRDLDAFAVSRDGRWLAYTAEMEGRLHLFVRLLGAGGDRRLPGSEGAHAPFFSPDATWLAFFAEGRLKRVRADGSAAPEEICEAPADSAGGTWTDHGRIIFAPLGGQGLVEVDADGGAVRALTRRDAAAGEIAHGWPHALPDDAGTLFTISRRGRNARMALLASDGTAAQHLLPVVGQAQYLSSGHLVYGYLGNLMVVRFEIRRRRTRGSPVPIAKDLQSFGGYSELGRSAFAVAAEGTLLWLRGEATNPSSQLAWVDREGRSLPLWERADRYQSPRFSPDGTRLAVAVRSGVMNRDLWVFDPERPDSTVVRLEGGDNHSPAWLPDGRLSYASNRDGLQDIHVAVIRGAPRSSTLIGRAAGAARNPVSWARRQPLLAFYEVDPISGRDIWLFRLGAPVPVPLVATRANERSPALSPDGRWLAYVSDESGRDEVYLRDSGFGIRESGTAQRISVLGGVEPLWSRQGTELLYRAHDQMIAVPVDPETGGAGSPRRLFERRFDLDPGGNLPNYDISPDGRRLLMLQSTFRPRELQAVVNWGSEVARLAPGPR